MAINSVGFWSFLTKKSFEIEVGFCFFPLGLALRLHLLLSGSGVVAARGERRGTRTRFRATAQLLLGQVSWRA